MEIDKKLDKNYSVNFILDKNILIKNFLYVFAFFLL